MRGEEVTYTCKYCKSYWKDQKKLLWGLGVKQQYITLTCPTCKRPEVKR